jgi:hypothetical protein
MKFRLILLLALCSVVSLTIVTGMADAQTVQPQGSSSLASSVAVQGYVSKATGTSDIPGALIPVAGAHIYFIRNNAIVANATSNPVGFYAVTLPPAADYTVAVSCTGFQSEIKQYDILNIQNLNFYLTPIPFNGFVPYALYPVLETSPGRETDCTIVVQNNQVVDQMVTFTVVTGTDMQAWFPSGQAMMVRSGNSGTMTFKLKYVGTGQGAQVMSVIVNGGAYFAEIPVILVVKNLPFEEISLWSYTPETEVKPGDTLSFVVNAENMYAQDKDIRLTIDKPDGWSVTTGNGTELYLPDGKTGSFYLWAYVPRETPAGNYTITLAVMGEGIKSNKLVLKVRVEGKPMFDAIIKGQNRSAEGYPRLYLAGDQKFELRVRIYNSWDFPVSIQATAEVGDNWESYIEGVPNGHVYIDPGKALEFSVKSQVPNGTYGNFTAKIYLESGDHSMTLLALINVPPPPPPPAPGAKHDWEGLALTGATAATFVLTVAASLLRRFK